jgi:hypothetical protein
VFVAQEEALLHVVTSLSNEVLSADRSAKTSGGALISDAAEGSSGLGGLAARLRSQR